MTMYSFQVSASHYVIRVFVYACCRIKDCKKDAKFILSKATMIRSFWLCQQRLVLPFVPDDCSTCANCGACPSRLIGDGVSVQEEYCTAIFQQLRRAEYKGSDYYFI